MRSNAFQHDRAGDTHETSSVVSCLGSANGVNPSAEAVGGLRFAKRIGHSSIGHSHKILGCSSRCKPCTLLCGVACRPCTFKARRQIRARVFIGRQDSQLQELVINNYASKSLISGLEVISPLGECSPEARSGLKGENRLLNGYK
jgi:hypothetical protein